MLRTSLLAALQLSLAGAFAQSYMQPSPYGGDASLKWFLEQDLRFPAADLQNNVEGEVHLGFVVQADGSVTDTRILGGPSAETDAEALRILSLIRWHPASVGGTAMNTEHTLSIPFSAKKWKKLHNKEPFVADAFEAMPKDSTLKLHEYKELDSLAVPLIERGIRGLPAYIAGNLRYPEEAYRRDIQGKVGLEFVVETNGHVSNLRTVNALGGGCDDEAMRLMRTIKWKPAFKKGLRVRSIVKLDIQFKIDPTQR
jgi:periplasmic protein TonB